MEKFRFVTYFIRNEKVENLLSCLVLRQVSGKPDLQTKPSKSKRHAPLHYALLRRESLPFQITFASKSKPPSDNLSRLQPDLSSPHLHSSHSLLPHPPVITFSPLLNFYSSRVLPFIPPTPPANIPPLHAKGKPLPSQNRYVLIP